MFPLGAFSEWWTCNIACAHDWDAWSYRSGDVSKGAGDLQVLHKRIRPLSYKWGLFLEFPFPYK